MELNEISIKLSQQSHEGAEFDAIFINQFDHEVLQVTVNQNDELPVFITRTEEQILCICYLFTDADIHESKKYELNEVLLKLNIPMPLSAFAKLDDRYAIFGALSVTSSFEQILSEITTLAGNSIDALDVISEYLVE